MIPVKYQTRKEAACLLRYERSATGVADYALEACRFPVQVTLLNAHSYESALVQTRSVGQASPPVVRQDAAPTGTFIFRCGVFCHENGMRATERECLSMRKSAHNWKDPLSQNGLFAVKIDGREFGLLARGCRSHIFTE